MKFCNIFLVYYFIFVTANAYAMSGPSLEKGQYQFGAELGYSTGLNLPLGLDRPDIQFFHFSANFEYDLTGNIGKSFYQGNLYWFTELNADFLHNPDFGSLVGISPIMLKYKFLKPNKKWAPSLLGGAGFSLTDWDKKEVAEREIAGNFQFLLHFGAGLEFFRPEGGSFLVNYRFFHVSNAGTQRPNIGLNSTLITIGFTF